MTALIDSRVVRIVRWLLSQTKSRSTADLAGDLGLSERTVRYRLPTVARYLSSCGAELQVQRGTGLLVEVDPDLRQKIIASLDEGPTAPRVYTPEEREHLLLDLLLWAYPETISLGEINTELEVSKTSARRDLKKAEPWLERMGLSLIRAPGRGIALLGSEQKVRRAIVQLSLESVPLEVLRELVSLAFEDAVSALVRIPAGLHDRFSALSLRECAAALSQSELQDRLQDGTSDIVFTLYLAITRARAKAGRKLDLEPGQFRSLSDHPIAGNVRELVDSLSPAQPFAADLGTAHDGGVGHGRVEHHSLGKDSADHEIAGVTEYFLGLGALAEVNTEESDHAGLIEDILTLASDRLHLSLAEDGELRRSLAMHLNRLRVRLQYGLPVHNPLLADVVERYPDVHAVSTEAVVRVGEAFGHSINEDEVGFITMYLSGAMERSHLKPRKQALVVCPSGMATVWVLVSRLQAEFPQLALVDVRSAKEYDTHDTEPYDLVISTVKIEERDAPVVVVSPLLSSSDLKTLGSML